MQPERKARLQAAIDTLREVQKDIYKGDNSLHEEAVKAQETFDKGSDEYDTLNYIANTLSVAYDEITDALIELAEIFGADGADDEPDEEEDDSDDDELDEEGGIIAD